MTCAGLKGTMPDPAQAFDAVADFAQALENSGINDALSNLLPPFNLLMILPSSLQWCFSHVCWLQVMSGVEWQPKNKDIVVLRQSKNM